MALKTVVFYLSILMNTHLELIKETVTVSGNKCLKLVGKEHLDNVKRIELISLCKQIKGSYDV